MATGRQRRALLRPLRVELHGAGQLGAITSLLALLTAAGVAGTRREAARLGVRRRVRRRRALRRRVDPPGPRLGGAPGAAADLHVQRADGVLQLHPVLPALLPADRLLLAAPRRPAHALLAAMLLLVLYLLHPLAWLFGVLSLTHHRDRRAREAVTPTVTRRPGTTARRLMDVWLAAAPGVVLLFVLIGQRTGRAPPSGSHCPRCCGTSSLADRSGRSARSTPRSAPRSSACLRSAPSSRGGRRASDDASNALAWVTGAYLLLLVVLPSQWKSLGLITERVGHVRVPHVGAGAGRALLPAARATRADHRRPGARAAVRGAVDGRRADRWNPTSRNTCPWRRTSSRRGASSS